MKGKDKCEMLKSIRKSIAEKNGISYESTPCNHEGNCLGFCPQCDREVEALMRELKKKEEAGCPIQIDVESLAAFDNVAQNQDEFIEVEERLEGDIIWTSEIFLQENE